MAGDEENMLTEQLKRWGYYTVNRIAVNDDGPSGGDSVLAKKRNEAPGKKNERKIVGRDGDERRRFMAARISADSPGVSGARLRMAIVPTWAVDPVPARNDADAPREVARAMVALDVPDDLRWIDEALSRLARVNRVQAMVLREEYCGVGTQERKAANVQGKYGGRITLRQYRDELRRARDFLRGRMAA
jgi:hypothetical protein